MNSSDRPPAQREQRSAGRDATAANRPQALRQQAEARFREKAARSPLDLDALSPEATRQMLHELRVHQIELEMQSEELQESQAALDRARAHYFDLYDLAPVGYCTVSEQGLILQCNLTLAGLLGVARGALVRQPFSRMILKEDQDIYYLMRKQLIDSGEPQSCELRMLKQFGTHFWAHLTATVAQHDGAQVLRIVLSDISARKRLEEAQVVREAFKLTILNSLAAEIAVVNLDGVILEVNDAWRRFALENGLEPGKPVPHTDVGANYLRVCETGKGLASPDMLSACNGIKAVLDGSLPGFTMEYPCHSLTQQRWFTMNVLPLGLAKRSGAVIAHTDITDYKRLDQTLRDRNVELERARVVAEKANLAKSEFLSSMSHELRTPLHGILGFAQLIEAGSPEPTPGQKRSIDQILKAGWHLLELINEILDLSVIESGKLSLLLEPVSLAAVLTECELMIEPQAQKCGIRVTIGELDTGCFVNAERLRLKQVLINLLSNAVKYNTAGGAVAVECTPRPPDAIRISVRDTGPGLTPELLPHLFEAFNRLGQEAKGEEGTGIGLVVSKRLVELMGGEIGVESTLGEGSVFWIELKRATEPGGGGKLAEAADSVVSPKSALRARGRRTPCSMSRTTRRT